MAARSSRPSPGAGASPAGGAEARAVPAAAARARRAAAAPACLAGLLALGAAAAPPARAGAPPGPAECAGLRGGGPPRAHRDARWGFEVTYPSVFGFDPEGTPPDGGGARFRTPDGRAVAVVTALRNGLGQSLADLAREAERDVVENARGTVTYARRTPGWFVLSGHVAGRVFYLRTFLARGGSVIASLWIEFPPALRPCLEGPVAMMSLSFREPAAAAP